jgi:lysyl-tRNA synthetase class 2
MSSSLGGPRHRIGSLSGASAAAVRIAGRVLCTSPGQTRFVLVDDSGAINVTATEPALPCPGDFVEVEAELIGTTDVRAVAWRVLGCCRAEDPFPSPGGEYYRLHRGSPSRADLMVLRSRGLRAIRAFMDERGYVEVQTPQRVRCPGLEPHLRAEPAGERFLITSPEYHMKRLLAGGFERIYFLGTCWRGDEAGPHHLSEFCMLEWYRAFSSLEELMAETEALVAHVARELRGSTDLTYQGSPISLGEPFARITVTEAFRRFAGLEVEGVVDACELRRRADAAGLGPFGVEERFDSIAARILVDRVEPSLRGPLPVFLHDFPAPLAALSRLKAENPAVAERFELYAGGLELANAFAELTDPDEQRARLLEDQAARRAAGAPVYPVDDRFIAALREGIPPSAGIALGVDRLLMLLCDVSHVAEVVAFGPDEV